MDAYDIAGACHEIVAFLDALNNWYIRRSRDRFWAPGSVDRRGAAATTSATRSTPSTPCWSRCSASPLPCCRCWRRDEIHTGLTGERLGAPGRLARPPTRSRPTRHPRRAMDEVRAVCSTALGLREEHKLRTGCRSPSLTVAGERRRCARCRSPT
jgi:isoleucyl-tRNA synthetase